MAFRRVYFCFEYGHDLDRVRQFYRLSNVISKAPGGFDNSDVWVEARRVGDAAVHGLINDALMNTSVTVVCLSARTAHGKYTDYQIERSLAQGNGLVGLKINHLRDTTGAVDKDAPVPPLIERAGYKVYTYTDKKALVEHIEEAAEIARRTPSVKWA